MIESVVVFGVVIFVGFMFIFMKLTLSTRQWLLGHAMLLDLGVTALALAIHWGTMTGLMAAAVAGLMCSATTSLARWLWGYRDGKRVIKGALS